MQVRDPDERDDDGAAQWLARARARAGEGDREGAMAAFRRAAELDEEARLDFADWLAGEGGDGEYARVLYREALQADPHSVRAMRGWLRGGSGRGLFLELYALVRKWREPRLIYTAIEVLQPYHRTTEPFVLGCLFAWGKHYHEAVYTLSQLPPDADSLNLLGCTYALMRDRASAIRCFRHGMTLPFESVAAAYRLRFNLAIVLYLERSYQEALDQLEVCARFWPEDEAVRVWLKRVRRRVEGGSGGGRSNDYGGDDDGGAGVGARLPPVPRGPHADAIAQEWEVR